MNKHRGEWKNRHSRTTEERILQVDRDNSRERRPERHRKQRNDCSQPSCSVNDDEEWFPFSVPRIPKYLLAVSKTM
jgi:hypothetical protein